jgi:hypothetical protein
MSLRLSISIVWLLLSKAAFAQVLNAEAFKSQDKVTEKMRGLYSFGFTADKQRSLIYTLSSDLDMSFRIKKQSLLTAARLRVSGTSEQMLLNGGFVHFRLRDNTGKILLTEEYVQYQWDGVRGLKNRFILGANLRQKILDDSLTQLFGGFGAFYEFEEWGLTAVPAAERPVGITDFTKQLLKFNTYIRFSRAFARNARFSTVFYYQALPAYYFKEYRLAGTFQLAFRISRHIDFNINYDGIYDTQPVVPIDQFYFNISNQFVLKF